MGGQSSNRLRSGFVGFRFLGIQGNCLWIIFYRFLIQIVSSVFASGGLVGILYVRILGFVGDKEV